jgi:hypothetical protein
MFRNFRFAERLRSERKSGTAETEEGSYPASGEIFVALFSINFLNVFSLAAPEN